MDSYLFIYKLLNLKGVGRVKANLILDAMSNVINKPKVSIDEVVSYSNTYLQHSQVKEIFSENGAVENSYYKAKEGGVKFLQAQDIDYPESLKKLNTAKPGIISYLGNIDILYSKKIGFCGSRKASPKGLDVATDITQQVTEKNITVVSGYASGIDQQTHYWALKNGGKTIIVLPEGINHFRLKAFVKDVWDWDRVLIISEFAPQEIWSAGRAMERNSTIIGLSDIMILIEAGAKGGSIDAGNKTLKLGKKLFAPVYEGMPIEASGNQILLGQGALPLKKKRETNRANLDLLFDLLKI